jgi:hypothetical protein
MHDLVRLYATDTEGHDLAAEARETATGSPPPAAWR